MSLFLAGHSAIEGAMKLSAFSTSSLNAAIGRMAARLRSFAEHTARARAASGSHPPAPPALGAFGLLVGDDHRRN
jgi:hypothetical protein